MSLMYIGLWFLGIFMSLSAAEMFPTIIKFLRKPAYGRRASPRVVTRIHMRKENDYES